MSAPPPLPPSSSEGLPPSAVPPASGAAPPPKNGLSGCAIAAIVLGVVGVIGLVAIGILAAIAIPQYQDYVVRSQLAQASSAAYALQFGIDEHVVEYETCPDPDAFDTLAADPLTAGTADSGLAGRWEWIEADGERCGFSLVFEKPGHRIDGTTLVFRREADGGWSCDEGTLPAEYRRLGCSTAVPASAN